MNTIELIAKLKKEASDNQVLNDVLHMFMVRQRARDSITLHALALRMEKEGFKHEKKQYAACLKFLGEAGLGKLDLDKRGNVRALRDIKITLQSVGAAVIGGQKSLQSWKPRNRYQALPQPTASNRQVAQAPAKAPLPRGISSHEAQVILMVVVNEGKQLSIPVPKNFSSEEIAYVVDRFKNIGSQSDDDKERASAKTASA